MAGSIYNTEETRERILNQIKNLTNQIVVNQYEEQFSKKLISCVGAILDANDERLLFGTDTMVFVFVAEKLTYDPNYSFLGDMLDELKKKTVRRWLLGGPNSSIHRSAEVLERKDNIKQFTRENGLILPEVGSYGTVNEYGIDEKGKRIVRRFVVDSDGYAVNELEPETNEASDIKYPIFHPDLEEAAKLKKDTDTIIEARETCGEGKEDD